MSFENYKLPKRLLSSLNEQGITEPTPIQEKAIPVVLSGKDVIGVAQTGTGKTLAYLLPIIRDLKFSDQRQPRVLILVPTRELAVQVATEVERLTTHISLRTLAIFGGKNINTQKQQIQEGCDILVATPGRVYDLAMTGILRFQFIQKLVIDECDEMLNLGFKPQLTRIIELLPAKRQNMMFSATLTEDVDSLIEVYFKETERVFAAPSGTPVEQIEQTAYQIPNFYTKLNFLVDLLTQEEFERSFIFVKSKQLADKVQEELEERFPEQFGVLHSNKSQNYRLRMVQEFKEGKLIGLVATDLVARGIDIEDVSHVINFDIPEQVEQYVHRIGRTGRMDKKGNAISFVSEKELPLFENIQGFIKMKLDLQELPENIVVSEKLLPEEQEVNIHDAPTLLNLVHTPQRKEDEPKQVKKVKVNIRPKERVAKRKAARKRRRRK